MRISLIIIVLFSFIAGFSQEMRVLKGTINSDGQPIPFATIYANESEKGASADESGHYELELPASATQLSISAIGFKTLNYKITPADYDKKSLDFSLLPDLLGLEEVVVSATRNQLSKKKAPVIVQVMSPKLLRATQSISLADGLNYQPGVRVETNCQNCGFTQVRLNGLDGQYTQVLLNSRPVFSALNGVYGLEQIPVSIIDRVEVIRSGGSALYGSSAIAGTVNIITKDPVNNSWELSSNLSLIDGTTADRNLNLNTSLVSEDLSNGISIYGIYRDRDAYDANDDGFSEITKLTNHSIGAKAFYRPNDNSKIGLDLTAIKEYRRGGDRLEFAPPFTDITEELDHNTFFGGADYEWHNADRSTTFETYASLQHTDRGSYYGGLGGGRTPADSTLAANAFGDTQDLALVSGAQLTRKFTPKSTLTSGIEYRLNDTRDAIPGYQRLVDQEVHNLGAYTQLEYKAFTDFTALLGVRLDYVNVNGNYAIAAISRNVELSQTVASPRLTILYNLSETLQFRGGYARGFRAPQAFNEDLHISSVGGEQRFAILSENLKSEYSNAYTASLNLDRSFNKVQTSLLLEGFYTTLKNPFTLVSTGATLPNGSILEESRNGSGARVAGATIEFNFSPGEAFLFQAGLTWQQSMYNQPQLLFESDGTTDGEQNVTTREFLRSPNTYGFFNANWKPSDAFKIDLSGSFTGSMLAPHVVSNSGFMQIEKTPAFLDLTPKITWHLDLQKYLHLELSGGVQNLFNSYQQDFDQGPLRDSNYIYGPNRPRTFFLGLRFGDF